MGRQITAAELQADKDADLAAEVLRKFRLKHAGYFHSAPVVDKKGRVTPFNRNEALERESFRLFEIVRQANKRALDIEYAAHLAERGK